MNECFLVLTNFEYDMINQWGCDWYDHPPYLVWYNVCNVSMLIVSKHFEYDLCIVQKDRVPKAISQAYQLTLNGIVLY